MSDNSKLCSIYHAMMKRCYNVNDKYYYIYGEKGITVCSEWRNTEKIVIKDASNTHLISKGYLAFKNWALSSGYKEGLTIDRINVEGNYEPSNCRWVTMQEQNNNKTNNIYITYKGIKHTLKEWSDIYGINYQTLYDRMNVCKLSFEEAISRPVDKASRYLTYKGVTKSMADWARDTGIPYHTLKSRLNNLHWTVEKALATPIRGE